MQRIKILVNPSSGNGAGKKLLSVVSKLNAKCEVQETDTKNILTQVKKFVAVDDIVIIAGGDGTVNLVINALYHTGLYQHVKVALLPLGTGNDLAAALAIKSTSLEKLIGNLSHANIVPLALWRFNDRVFTNYISWGIDAWALKQVTRWRRYFPQRRWLMKLLYLIAGILALFRWRKIRLSSAELSLNTPVLSLIFCNTHIYAGGCPVTIGDMTTPQLSLIKIRHHRDLINLMWRRFSKNPYPTIPIEHATFQINTENSDAEVDGEMLAICKGAVTQCGWINFLV